MRVYVCVYVYTTSGVYAAGDACAIELGEDAHHERQWFQVFFFFSYVNIYFYILYVLHIVLYIKTYRRGRSSRKAVVLLFFLFHSLIDNTRYSMIHDIICSMFSIYMIVYVVCLVSFVVSHSICSMYSMICSMYSMMCSI